MAKKTSGNSSDSDFLLGILKESDSEIERIDESVEANVDEWISTGNYILNACLSGSIFGGIANNRSTCFSGESGTGKSYLALSICRCAQEAGYMIMYCDSEGGAIDKEFVTKLGCDPSKFFIKQVQTIQDFSHFLASLTKKLTEAKERLGTIPKTLLVLDSLGNLASEKEVADSVDGKNVADFTKQKAIRSLFRVNGSPLSKLKIPFIITNHTYEVVGSYVPKKEISGGGGIKFNASVIAMLTKAKLADDPKAPKDSKTEIISNGIVVSVSPIKQRFAKPIKVKMTIPTTRQPNPYIGLEDYISWEACGVVRGTIIETAREYDKLSDAEKSGVYEMERDGVKKWVVPKETARSYVCRHLFDKIPVNELHTSKVFTQQVLQELDQNAIKPAFELPKFDKDIYANTADINDGVDYSIIE